MGERRMGDLIGSKERSSEVGSLWMYLSEEAEVLRSKVYFMSLISRIARYVNSPRRARKRLSLIYNSMFKKSQC